MERFDKIFFALTVPSMHVISCTVYSKSGFPYCGRVLIPACFRLFGLYQNLSKNCRFTQGYCELFFLDR